MLLLITSQGTPITSPDVWQSHECNMDLLVEFVGTSTAGQQNDGQAVAL